MIAVAVLCNFVHAKEEHEVCKLHEMIYIRRLSSEKYAVRNDHV